MKKQIAACIMFGMSLAAPASANQLSFQKSKTVDKVLNDQMSNSSGIQKLEYGMEVNMRCIAAMAAFRNSLNPVRDTNLVNNLNINIGNVALMAALTYDRLNNNGEPSRNDWNGEDLFDMFRPKMNDILAPYLTHYEELLQRANNSDAAAGRYKADIDTCADLASGYSKALRNLPAH